MASGGIQVQGLAEFRSAVRRAAAIKPSAITLGLKRAGIPIVAQAAMNAPYRSGALARSYTVSVRGARADVVSRVPYGGGAEWGRFGKWAGFPGSPPRYVYPALEQQADVVSLILMKELSEVIEIIGWAV